MQHARGHVWVTSEFDIVPFFYIFIYIISGLYLTHTKDTHRFVENYWL